MAKTAVAASARPLACSTFSANAMPTRPGDARWKPRSSGQIPRRHAPGQPPARQLAGEPEHDIGADEPDQIAGEIEARAGDHEQEHDQRMLDVARCRR